MPACGFVVARSGQRAGRLCSRAASVEC